MTFAGPMLPFAGIVLAAFAVEATLGFGATVIAVSFGVLLLPLDELLAALVPANLVLSATIAFRHRRQIDRALLGRRILPLMALGLPAGLLLARVADERRLELLFGVVVVALAGPELVRSFRRDVDAGPRPPLRAPLRAALLVAAGVIHGAFSTGGPLVVYVTDRVGLDKGRFRATLSALWLLLGLVLLASFAARGTLSATSATRSALLLGPLLLGLATGEWLHRRVDALSFRRAVMALLVTAGATLALRRAF